MNRDFDTSHACFQNRKPLQNTNYNNEMKKINDYPALK